MNPHLSKGAAVLKIVSLEIYGKLKSYGFHLCVGARQGLTGVARVRFGRGSWTRDFNLIWAAASYVRS